MPPALKDRDARLIEIAQNLHRAELTVAERAAHIAEWIKLTGEVSEQVAPKPQGGRPEGGTAAAARTLGVGRDEAKRAVRIARIAPEATRAAVEAGLDDNQSALLEVAKVELAEQVAKVAEIVERKSAPKPKPPRMKVEPPSEAEPAPIPAAAVEPMAEMLAAEEVERHEAPPLPNIDAQVADMKRAYLAGCTSAQSEFRQWIEAGCPEDDTE